MKLWNKGYSIDEWVESFTVGNDRIYDKKLAPYDVKGTMAHVEMLGKVGLLEEDEVSQLVKELNQILENALKKDFEIPAQFEDIHSYVEYILTERLGDIGKRVHTGRSRNDQVLVDLHMFFKGELEEITQTSSELCDLLLAKADEYKESLIPGYTHMQVAMPSSMGLWFSAYAELIIDDLIMLKAAHKVCDQNPLGSAAGYGTSFPLDRDYTTKKLGFNHLKFSSASAQMSRGKTEKTVAFGLASIASTLSKLAHDVILFMCQNFQFISFPEQLTTGSSIMPHKKNPDVFELVRAKCNKIQSLPQEIAFITNNLNSGYHRDFQILKEGLFAAFEELKSCLQVTGLMLESIKVNKDIVSDEKYNYLFTVESVNELVIDGMPFRDAYQKVGAEIQSNTYQPQRTVKHSHKGSIGNLCIDEIKAKKEDLIK